ncbi:hypothetical protein FRC11_009351 [Ceratobasidium sp. 423]|nr:hypothetical protein FRC11_009351 [Ceratobasidium sp. 423]
MYIDLYYGCEAPGRHESQVVYGEDEDAISEGVGRRLVSEEEGEEPIADEASEHVDECEDEDEDDVDVDADADAEGSEDSELEPEGELVQINSGTPASPHVLLDPEWSIATKPTVSCITCDKIMEKYGALDFISQTNEWLQESSATRLLPPLQFVTHDHPFDIWHKFYLHHRALWFDPDLSARRDTIRAQPPLAIPNNSLRSISPGNFDTVLFLAKPKEFGIHRYRAGRVRVIFKLPAHLSTTYPHPLVYLELFTPFSKDFSSVHRMHTLSHDMHRGIRRTIIILLVWVVAVCHLAPLFSQFDNDLPFDCYDVLSIGKEFFFNHYSSHFIFGLVDHWRTIQDQVAKAKAAERRAIEEEARRARAARGKAARAKLVQVRNAMESCSH